MKELTPKQQRNLAAVETAEDLYAIGAIIASDWAEKMNYAAVPYVNAFHAMHGFMLGDARANYGADNAKSMVIYFLGNAATWKGPVAKAVKARLKKAYGVK
jgi:hypothetical protein